MIKDLIEIRESKGYSQRQLASRIGVSYTTIQDIENGKRGIWMEVLDKWLEACDISTAGWLLQYLSDDERGMLERDKELVKWFRKALRDTAQRKIFEALHNQWTEQQGALSKKVKRKRPEKQQSA